VEKISKRLKYIFFDERFKFDDESSTSKWRQLSDWRHFDVSFPILTKFLSRG